jgi:hypothetical protein
MAKARICAALLLGESLHLRHSLAENDQQAFTPGPQARVVSRSVVRIAQLRERAL